MKNLEDKQFGLLWEDNRNKAKSNRRRKIKVSNQRNQRRNRTMRETSLYISSNS